MSAQEPVEITVGYRGLPGLPDRLEQRRVEQAAGDAPPWDANTQFQVVGGDLDRVDGLAKASGRARYAFDIKLPGMLHGAILRSSVARGKLSALDLDRARTMPGIRAVVALKEPGNRLRFVGDPIAAVAGSNPHQVRDAIEAIRVGYETEAHTVDFLQLPGVPTLDDRSEVEAEWPPHDKIDAALAGAATTHSGTYRVEVQTHSSLESHGGVAHWTGEDLEVWNSTQATFGIRGELAQAIKAKGIKLGTLTVHAEFVGGGFGSKFSAGVEGLACCLLAREANAPVKLMLDRFEEHTCTGNRPAALMQVRAGLDADGRLCAWDWRSFGGCGFNGSGGSVAVPNFYQGKAARRSEHKDFATDTDPARPARAPGHPQGFFAAELFLDELAAKAGIDPLELRLRNDETPMRQDQWRHGAERFGWAAARAQVPDAKARMRRGVGLASARWGNLGSAGRPAHGITCRIHRDGSVEVRSGAQDIGTGLKTVMVAIAAEELGVPASQIQAITGHTSDPSGPASGGSTVTPSLAPAIRNAAMLARRELEALVAGQLGVPAETVQCRAGRVGTAERALPFAEACKYIGPNPIDVRGQRFANYEGEPFHRGVCGCQFAEVEVDTWTGIIRVTRMLAIQDCGLVIAKKPAESQVLGAMIQGVSYALHEQRILDAATGRMLNGDFLRYKISGPKDLPELTCILHSVTNGHANVSAAGLGEPPSVAAPAAIANAIFHALGIPLRHLPITPDKVLRALQQNAPRRKS